MTEMINRDSTHAETCAICGSGNARSIMVHHEFEYKCGSRLEVLAVQVPIVECADCEEAYFGDGAEDLKHEAVCDFLERLTPSKIVKIREKLGMSQAQLAAHTGIGIASIKRWETGLVIQGAALDQKLRELERSFDQANKSVWQPKFRTKISDAVRERARSFSLRPNCMIELEAA